MTDPDENAVQHIPNKLLEQISEHSRGFMLLTINNNGDFEIYTQHDDTVSRLGMLYFIELHVNTIKVALEESALTNTVNQESSDDDDDEDDKENGDDLLAGE